MEPHDDNASTESLPVESEGDPEPNPGTAEVDLYSFTLDELKRGSDRQSIAAKMVSDLSMSRADAEHAANQICSEYVTLARAERYSSSAFAPAVLGGLLAAAGGAAAWAALLIYGSVEHGAVAWGIGLLAGYAVVWSTGGKKGAPLQVIAVGSALLGIIGGKFASFAYSVISTAVQEAREPMPPLTSPEMLGWIRELFPVFLHTLPELADFSDLVFVGLAVYTAWRVPEAVLGFISLTEDSGFIPPPEMSDPFR